ncbi:bifunctional enoyl-CoA hydratase/phosphate acetyltransferase [Thermotoga sp. KOL6]|uniref:bifunctional enoyl-CoA hydratase/phosphate acetyltransferase n=1 Tax=Thermotoga sp. KOL6 TaxID=126741 RepID=UPI000C767025|nr:bifunctional enoyl-CoA hydratase/phosphate acetyltransferase [Thermotoga sp. KOL6]PLV59864.1 phosphate butyryltransferase [Thermotoga sp. KOL6]
MFLERLVEKARGRNKRLAVAVANDENVIQSVFKAWKENVCDPVLFGPKEEILKIVREFTPEWIDPNIVDCKVETAGKFAVEAVSEGECDFLMKGKIKTGDLMKIYLKEEYGLRTGKTISMVSVMEVPDFGRPLIVSDPGMVINPTLEQKIDMIDHCVRVARVLGIETPKVAIVGAIEVVNPKMPITMEAAVLSKMNQRGQIKGCIVDGPFALDNVVSKEAAQKKGIESPVAGTADILILPNIEAANIFYKALVFLAKARSASTILGGRVPVVLTSRADSEETKYYSIVLSSLFA